ncbi:MAG: DNA polymerase III subunit gamma/tau [Opitutales bacterium]|nr:DNA polymerase III subunit gamma/tau [Opitutales bacterium]
MAGAFQVIARRWRPQQFDEIVGQEHIVKTLKNAIETGRIGHAYLFVGPRGTGKTTTARIFAKALNCTGGPSVAPAKDDPICQAITAGSCLDVIEIDAATNRSIEDAKKIREECFFAPAQCRFKIYIIDEVHQLSKDAFNALLKVIEEPPAHVKFIFATTEADKVLETITSRCQRFEFQPIPEEKIVKRLQEITATDSVEASREALFAIARLANGGMRDSQSILDQVISFCGKKISESDVLDIYGLASKEQIEGLASAMAAADYATVVKLADTFVTEGRDLLRVLRHTQIRIREALLDSIRNGGVSTLLGQAMRTEQLLRMLDALQRGEGGVRLGLSERANFEVCLLKAVEQSRSRAIDSLIKDISTLAADAIDIGAKKKLSGKDGGTSKSLPLLMKFKDAFARYKTAREAEEKTTTPIVPAAFSRTKTQVAIPEAFLKMPPTGSVPEATVAVPAEILPTLEEALKTVPAEIRAFLKEKLSVDFTNVVPATETFCARVDEGETSDEAGVDDPEPIEEPD